MSRAVFLDRDGTLNAEVGFVRTADQLRILPGVAAALAALHDRGFRLVVVTNQSGIARGYYGEHDLAAVHARMHAEFGGRIAGWLHCPHHPDADGPYGGDCACRKPKSGLLHQARELLGVSFAGSYLVGDSARDLLMARDLPITTVHVHSGKPPAAERDALRAAGHVPMAEVADLPAAVAWILRREAAATTPPVNAAAPDPLARAFAELQRGVAVDRGRSFAARAELLAACAERLAAHAATWVERACRGKRIAADSPAVADEWANGPLVIARLLREQVALCRGLARGRLPAVRRVGNEVPAAPRGLDRLVVPGYRAVTEVTDDGGPLQQAPPAGGQGVHVVLGAGNVTSMPIGDALAAIAQRGAAVLLKLSPLHADLLPTFAAVLQPLVDADLLRLCVGDGDLGGRAVAHPAATAWHLTGAPATLRQVLASPLARGKPWTAELGNVTPVCVLPGAWSERDRRGAARQLAAWLQQNAACNCVTPRLVLLAARWPQRAEFTRELAAAIAAAPPRWPFHPAARAAFADRTGTAIADGPLPFALRADLDLDREPQFAAVEAFAPVLATIAVAGDDALAFAVRAAALVRERVHGALAAHVLAPPAVRQREAAAVQHLRRELPHGTLAINTWAAVGYALTATPWGTGATAQGAATGRGFTHGTLCLRAPVRTVVTAPWRPWPAPPWLPTAAAPAMLAALTRVHQATGATGPGRIAALAVHALRHHRAAHR